MSENRKAAIVTNNLLCEMNTKYYSMLERYFQANQWTITASFTDADIVVFSTCGFADWMHQAIYNALQELQKINFPDQKIIIMGCQPKTHETELKNIFKGRMIEFGHEYLLDQVIGAAIPFKNIEVTNLFRPYRNNEPVDQNELFTIQIADGCLKQCTYCVINKAHGDIRSVPLVDIERQYKMALQKGYRNINLIAIDTLSYGYDTGTNINELIEHLLTIDSNVHFYLGSLHIRWLANYWEGLLSFCKRGIINSLHIGLQHVDDEILKKMGRPVKFADLYIILCSFKKECPNLFISTDIIVGFPGETDAIFETVLEFFRKDHCFTLVNHFAYSDVKGAPACRLSGKVNDYIKLNRWEKLKEVLGERFPDNALRKNDSIKLRRYQAAHQYANEQGYYFCQNTFAE
ncbi:MAG TPA: radical SAM protein [Bacillota bacterium]|nr:radical SAM protein [Bacillota bacterium]